MALRPVTSVSGTEPGAQQAAAPVTKLQECINLNSVAGSRPRGEFLAAETYFGKKSQKIRTQAYLDTLASYCFISERLYDSLRQADPTEVSWECTAASYDYSVAVAQEVHTAPVIRTTVFATAIGEGNGLGIAPDWLARSRIESDWSVARDPGQRGA